MEIEGAYALLVPLVLAVTEIIKRAGVPKKFAPIVSIVLGIVFVWLSNHQDVEWLAGIVIGLSASGLWSGAKSVVKG